MKHLTRQFDLIPEDCLTTPVTIIGAGAIGSWVALGLAKTGFRYIQVWDFDVIDVENMNSQFYRFRDIGRAKVAALSNLVHDFTNIRIDQRNERYEKGRFDGIVVSAVDSMAVRKTIWENHKNVAAQTLAVVDPRMGAETALLYTMKPMDMKDIDSYEKSLYSDSEASQERCTAKATQFCALMLSGLVVKTVVDIAAGKPYTRTATWSIKNSQFQGWIRN